MSGQAKTSSVRDQRVPLDSSASPALLDRRRSERLAMIEPFLAAAVKQWHTHSLSPEHGHPCGAAPGKKPTIPLKHERPEDRRSGPSACSATFNFQSCSVSLQPFSQLSRGNVFSFSIVPRDAAVDDTPNQLPATNCSRQHE
jgi:hypothetical protein